MDNFMTITTDKTTYTLQDSLTPSNITIGYEFIKSTERSLDGSLQVDSSGKKNKLQVIYDYLKEKDFAIIKEIFGLNENQVGIQDMTISYLHCDKIKVVVDNFAFEPFILDSNIHWKQIIIDLVEL